jgi:SAM-dependent methyltransferase
MTTPHTSWAEFYDTAYEQCFGESYQIFTRRIVEKIADYVQPPARIVDFGAGTGRLSIPLASMGYDVVAVEPCRQMLEQLSGKTGGKLVTTVESKMQDFQTIDKFDMAICVFTVLLYLLDEDALQKSIAAAADALKTGGLLLIDIPDKAVFHSYRKRNAEIERYVTVTAQGDDLYCYEESTTVTSGGKSSSYSDKFMIRYWEKEYVIKLMQSHGLVIKEDLTEHFYETGSPYFLMCKRGKPE